jgi:hypothetical protein
MKSIVRHRFLLNFFVFVLTFSGMHYMAVIQPESKSLFQD